MGRVVAGRGHMTLLPANAAYRFRADAHIESLFAPDGSVGGEQTKITARAEGETASGVINRLTAALG